MCLTQCLNAYGVECVALIHGYGRGSFAMSRFNSSFIENGYKTIPVNYPSRSHDIKFIAEHIVLPQLQEESQKCSVMHFVGFSMGGVITRYILAFHRPSNLGRVVFIGCPHAGTELVNFVSKYKWIRDFLGPAAMDLHENSEFLNSVPDNVDYNTGVISGNFSISPLRYLAFNTAETDGTVSVESSKIKGMSDHIVIPVGHARLPYHHRVIEETLHFIYYKHFRR